MLSDTAVIVIAAIIFDLLLGDPSWFPHPVVGIGRLITFLEPRLRRLIHSERTAGIVLLVITVGTTAGLALAVLRGAYALNAGVGFVVTVVLAWSCLAARSLHRESRLVADALERGDMDEARRSLSFIVGRDTAALEEPEIWRGVVETVAENTSDGVIAPLLCLVVGGPVLALAYKAVNTLDSMVGYRNDRYLRFGWASARFDDLVNWLPARLTGLLMVVAASCLGLSGRNAWHIMLRDGRNHSSPNSGIPEAAAAGALGVQLGGTNFYFGKPVAKPTIGDQVNSLGLAAYRGVVQLMYGALFLLMGIWLLVSTSFS